MAARKLGSFLRQYLLSLFFLFTGCFFFPKNNDYKQKRRKKKLKTVSSSTWTYLKRVFLSTTRIAKSRNQTHPNGLTSVRSSQNSLVTLVQPDDITASQPDPETRLESDHHSLFFHLRNEIFPCTTCGEIFPKINLLDQHIAIKHAVSELIDGESNTNIVKIIFKSGWPEQQGNNKVPEIYRILKIHNSPKILARFEEYREFVKAKAARGGGGGGRRRWDDERCVADGNELLRFYCSTFMCNLGRDGDTRLCGHQYCSVCGIIGGGFSPKLDGIATFATGWRGHLAVPEDVEEEFGFMNVKRAMLVCRVVAGRVGCDLIGEEEEDDVDKSDGGYDSLVGQGTTKSGALLRIDDEELFVFNPRAVLPCFVIVYTV